MTSPRLLRWLLTLALACLTLTLIAPTATAQTYQADPAWGGPKGERPLLGSKPGGGAGDPATKDGPGGGSPTPGSPTRVPVDGGLALLACRRLLPTPPAACATTATRHRHDGIATTGRAGIATTDDRRHDGIAA